MKTRNVSTMLLVLLVAFLLPGIPWAQAANRSLAPSASPPTVGNVEDWMSISLASSHLHADRPLLGEKDDYPGFTRELIQVKWRPGDPIDLYLIKPKGVAKPPVILYLYTYPSETDRFRNDRFCADVTRDGFAAVGFVSALTGHRYQNRPMKQWFVSELQESLTTSAHDVQMILNYLTTRDDLDMSKVGMFGEGSGGTIAVLAAAVDPRIKVVDLLDPWADWPDWMAESELVPDEERANYVKPEFIKKVAPLDPMLWLPQLKSQQIRIQQVMDDATTPEVAKLRIESAAPRTAQLVRYPSTPEFFHAVSGGRLFQWMKDIIRPTPQPQPATQNQTQLTVRPVESGRED